jgi:hypothetical protein
MVIYVARSWLSKLLHLAVEFLADQFIRLYRAVARTALLVCRQSDCSGKRNAVVRTALLVC